MIMTMMATIGFNFSGGISLDVKAPMKAPIVAEIGRRRKGLS